MSRGRIIFSAVVLLLGVAAVVAISRIDLPESPEAARERLAGINRELRAAGSAKITFKAQITPQTAGPEATFTGTSVIRFGETDEWDTTFSSIVADDEQPIGARSVRVGGKTYLTSPGLRAEDGRAWFTSTTAAFWGGTLGNPNLGLGDFSVWKNFVARTPPEQAFKSATEDLPDIDGGEHEFLIRCTPSADPNCPPSFGTDLDALFDEVAFPVYKLWLDDDDRVRRLDVEFKMFYDPADTPGEAAVLPLGEYIANLSFELDDFGDPVTITAPAADQITQSRLVKRVG